MSRKTKDLDENIHLAYGWDPPLNAFFLQVFDRRKEWKENNTDEQNRIADLIDPCGEGLIENYTTSTILPGKLVSSNELAEMLDKFEVDSVDVERVRDFIPIRDFDHLNP